MPEIHTIHGRPVIGWIQTEEQSGVPCGIVLVRTRDPGWVTVNGVPPVEVEYVTAWYRWGDREWSNGNYFMGKEALSRAMIDFVNRSHYTKEIT